MTGGLTPTPLLFVTKPWNQLLRVFFDFIEVDTILNSI